MTNEELVYQMQQGINTADNLEQLYKQNENFIYKIARRYTGYVEIDDLMQEGYIGLYEAVKRYEGDKEVKFLTYASFWIRNAMECCVESQGYTVRHSRDMRWKIGQFKKIVNAFELHHGRKPTDYELCYNLGLSQESLENLQGYIYNFSSLESLDMTTMNEDSDSTIGDMIASGYNLEDEVLDRMMEQDRKGIWNVVEQHTNPNENKVIWLIYGMNMTKKAAGEELGITGEAVRQWEDKALRKLRFPSVKRLLQDRYNVALSTAYRSVISLI